MPLFSLSLSTAKRRKKECMRCLASIFLSLVSDRNLYLVASPELDSPLKCESDIERKTVASRRAS